MQGYGPVVNYYFKEKESALIAKYRRLLFPLDIAV
jgi:hypothetical protein